MVGVVTLREQITEINNFFDCYYISFNICNKKLNFQMVFTYAKSATKYMTYHWLGKKPNNISTTTYIQRNANDFAIHRFNIHIKCKDTSGQTTLSCWMGLRKNFLINLLTSWLTNCPKMRLLYRHRFTIFAG